MDAVLERFIAHSPLSAAVRGAFEYALAPAPPDDLFARAVGVRDDRELLSSTGVDLVAAVVCRVEPSVHAACPADDHRPVNVTAVYARLARVPAAAGRDLVRHTADRLGPVIRAMGGAAPDPLPGYRVKILDGNHLGKTPRGLKPLRDVVAGPLPGQTLVVLDPALGPAIDAIPCDDGHARERSRLDAVPATVAASDVWVADRNVCTTGLLFGVAGRGGFFVIRRHATTLRWERGSEWVPAGRPGAGALDEQTVWRIEPGGTEVAVRRVRLTRDRPTRGGGAVIEVLTNRPAAAATAAAVAERYRGRWSVEGLFLRLTTVLACEVNTPGYPPAALSGFCVALAAGNVSAGVKGALRAAHGEEAADGVSDDHPAWEVSGACPGRWIAVPPETWAEIGGWSVGRMADWLVGLARGANRKRYRKAPRGPRKPTTPRTRFADAKHISTARLLNGEQD